MSTKSISPFDAAGETRTYDWSASCCIRGTPVESVRIDTVLIRVRCGWQEGSDQLRAKTCARRTSLVNMTLEGYKFFSLSFSVKDVVGSFRPCPAERFGTLGREATANDGDSVLEIPYAVDGESGTWR